MGMKLSKLMGMNLSELIRALSEASEKAREDKERDCWNEYYLAANPSNIRTLITAYQEAIKTIEFYSKGAWEYTDEEITHCPYIQENGAQARALLKKHRGEE